MSLTLFQVANGQNIMSQADSLKHKGLLMPALMKYAEEFAQTGSPDVSYKIASTSALLWTSKMRDTSFYFLHYAVKKDSTLKPLYDPQFLSLVDDPRWEELEAAQIKKYEAKHGSIKNEVFAKELFRMILKDQGFMYAGNIERGKYFQNGGFFGTPAIFPVLAMEEKNKMDNEKRLFELIDRYGWPVASEVTEYAAAGAALVINHSTYEVRSKYYPMLEEAFKKGEAQPLRYAKMSDRLLVEQGKKQLYGTQIKFENGAKVIHPIKDPENVDQRRHDIGLGALAPYLKERFDIDWHVAQKE